MTKGSRRDCNLFCHRHVLPSCSIRKFDWFINNEALSTHSLFLFSLTRLPRSLSRNMLVHMATWGTGSSVFNARASFKETVHNYFTSDFLGVHARGNIKKVWLIILIPHFDIINPPLSGVLPLLGLWSARNGTHKGRKRLHHLIVMMTLILNIFFLPKPFWFWSSLQLYMSSYVLPLSEYYT